MSIPVTVNGVKYRSIRQACKVLNKNQGTVFARKKLGYSIEQAINLPNLAKTPSRDHLGNSYSSSKEMCKAWHISNCTVSDRLGRGWSMEKALTTPIDIERSNKGKKRHGGVKNETGFSKKHPKII